MCSRVLTVVSRLRRLIAPKYIQVSSGRNSRRCEKVRGSQASNSGPEFWRSVCRFVPSGGWRRRNPQLKEQECTCDGRLASATHPTRSEEHTSELQSQSNLVCRLL